MESGQKAVDSKVLEARAKLAKKFGDVTTQIGGRGSERRKKKTTHKTQINDDKKLKAMIKKFNVHPLPEISEVNLFRNDNTVIQFKEPEVLASLPSNTFVVIGKSDQKPIKDLLPEIITHLGPKQLGALREFTKKVGKKVDEIKEENEDDEDIPKLVNQNFEQAADK